MSDDLEDRMTHQSIESRFTIDRHGIIRDPGRFEGEAIYVPYFYQAYLDGMADEDDGEVLKFRIQKQDLEQFPELADRKTVRLYIRENGFVCEV